MDELERCQHKDCLYRNRNNPMQTGNCDYLTLTGKSRTAGLPERLQLPCNCPRYEPKGSKPKKEETDWRSKALRLYQNGATDGEIAETLGVTRNRVQKWRYNTIKKPPNKAPKGPKAQVDYKKMSELYRAGWNDIQIAAELGCCQVLVFRWRLKNSLPPNRRHGKPKNETL